MKKPTALLFLSILLGGCASAAGTPPIASPSLTPTSTLGPVSTPGSTPTAATSPEPSAAGGCALLGPDGTVDLVITNAANGDRSGLDSTVPGNETDTWHQPDPASALVAARAERLTVTAVADTDQPICLSSIAVDATPFSPVAAQPVAAMIRSLSVTATAGGAASSTSFKAPAADGEWVVRVVAQTPGQDGTTRLERRFWRLRIGVPAPISSGKSSRAGACATPGDAAPSAVLSAGSMARVTGQPGSSTWRGVAADAGDEPVGTKLTATSSEKLTITTQGGVCAGWWRIVVAPRPGERAGYQLPIEPFADLVPRHGQAAGAKPGQANTFALGDLAVGDWVVRASLDFVDASGALIGQTTHYWNVVVQ